MSACRCRPLIPHCSTSKLAAEQPDLLRRDQGTAGAARHPDHRAVHASAGTAAGRASGLCRTVQGICGTCGARQSRCVARMGRRATAVRGAGQRAPGPQGACHVLRRTAVAHDVSVAAAPDGAGREGFKELARRWRPVLDVFAEAGVALCFEIHPGEDLHDGATFERFLDAVGRSRRREHPLRPQPLRAAAAGLPGVHRPVSRAHQGLSREGCGVPAQRPLRCLWRLPGLGRSARDASAHPATARSISRRSSASSRSTATTAGRCWSGSAA